MAKQSEDLECVSRPSPQLRHRKRCRFCGKRIRNKKFCQARAIAQLSAALKGQQYVASDQVAV